MVSLLRNDYRRRTNDEFASPAGIRDVPRKRRRSLKGALSLVPEVAVYDRAPHQARSSPIDAGLRRRLVHLLLDVALRLVPRDRDGLLLIALVRNWREYQGERPLNRLEPNVRT